MKCIFELTPSELGAAMKDGTLAAFIAHANDVQQLGTTINKERAAVAPAVQSFNPTIVAPVAAPATFDPMAMPGVAPAAPVSAPSLPAAPAAPAAPVSAPGATVTIDQVRAKLAPLVKAGKDVQIAALFKEFGAAKMTEVEPSNYAALIARAATL